MKNTRDIEEILTENARRRTARAARGVYDPLTGTGAFGDRVEVSTPLPDMHTALVPVAMTADPDYRLVKTPADWERLRCRHDFEYWCVRCVTVKDKDTGKNVPFRLNTPQRRVAAMLDGCRVAGKPMRMVMLKARQWGGSTLVQMYMAWIQSMHRTGWNSLICAHVKDSAANIRGMYTTMLEHYPVDLWEGEEAPAFKPFERSQNMRVIAGRNCRVTLASAENQDSIRGADLAMAHLSETAFWPNTPTKSPDDLIRAVIGSIAWQPYTLIVMESTANGIGNYFHTEWLRAENGKSNYMPAFVPWHEIDKYRTPVSDEGIRELVPALTDYEWRLWQQGLTMDQINWYHVTARNYQSAKQMQAEYPGTAIEAFTTTGSNVFSTEKVEALRAGVRAGEHGHIDGHGRFVPQPEGRLEVWERCDPDGDYITTVDIGGRWAGADWSVVAVMRTDTDSPRVVAQWRGHIDHDLLANRAIDIAMYYNQALLVVESNTLESEAAGGTGDGSLTVLERLSRSYPCLYMRQCVDRLTMAVTDRVGFHTNRRTKDAAIDALIRAVREGGYVERSETAINELFTYSHLSNGSYAARPGCHDDVLMTRAIALYVIQQNTRPSLPDPLPQIPVW